MLEGGRDGLCEFICPPIRVYQELGPSLAMGEFSLELLGNPNSSFLIIEWWSHQCLSDTYKVGQAETGVWGVN